MSRRNQAIRDRRTRLLLWGSIFIIITAAVLCRHPIIWKQESKIAAGVSITLDSMSDYLIVVDEDRFDPSPEAFPEMSFSLAWLNTFQQEIGPVSLMTSKSFPDADLNSVRVLVLTHSTAEHDDWAPKVRSFLERGGTVIAEMPAGKLRAIASADGKGGIRTPQSITYANGLSEELTAALGTLHLSDMTQLIGSAGPLDDAQTWLTIDGVPVIYSKKYAAGTVITVDFNYGMLLTALQQGRPLDDFNIRSVRGSAAFETEDLARTESVELPQADIIERFLIYGVLDKIRPAAGFWPFFDGMNGALIVTHSENNAGDAALWMPRYESTFKATSTLFAAAPLAVSDDGIRQLETFHTDLGLSFELDSGKDSEALEPMGFFKFSPVWKQHNIGEQAESIRKYLPETVSLIASQSRGGLWTREYTRAFRMLAAADFRADASYRPPADTHGYAFGTGFPFMPLDTNGRIFNILEFPVVFPVIETQEDVTALDKTLADSAAQSHEPVTVSFVPMSYPEAPDLEKFESWQETYRIANLHRHWITSIVHFLRFSRARFTAELRSRLVEMRVNNVPSLILRLEVLAPESGMTVTVPKSTGERTFAEARRGLQRIREDALLADPIQTSPVSVFGYERIIVPLTRGFNAIDIIYE